MKTQKDMTPGVVGTALAAVAAGSLVLFSLVLQQSAFDTSSTNGLKALSPSDSSEGINVAAAPDENDSAGGGTAGAETPTSEDTAPTTDTDSFSPILDDGDLVASTDDTSDDDFPGASGGTGNTVDNEGIGATVEAGGPQATINKDPNGRPDDVTLPDRNGPKNTSPPQGPRPDSDDDDSDDRADRDRDKPAKDGSSKDKDGSSKDKDGSSKDKDGSSKDKSGRDKAKTDKPRNPGKNNGGGGDNGRDDRSNDRDGEPEDRNDRHDTRRDSDEDDDRDDDDDNDRDDDSHHSSDDSRGHSRTRESKH